VKLKLNTITTIKKHKEVQMAKSTKKTVAKAVKFAKDSVEAVTIKAIKARQKKIENAGNTLVGLWYEQGKELMELQSVLECSQNALVKHTGLGRSAMKAYMGIAEDPRLGEEGISKQLGQFNQKQLVQLGKLDEDEFNDALETGALPANKEPSNIKEPKAKAEAKWSLELKDLIDDAKGDYDTAKEAILAYFELDVEVEESEDVTDEHRSDEQVLAEEAVALTEETEIEAQAKELGIKKGVLKKALLGDMSKTTFKKLTDYCNS